MSELINNLNQIYNVKLQLKQALETESDVFQDYPGYVTAMKPTGYTSIVENGDLDVSAYEYAYVNVPVPAGYVYVSGTKSIVENGNNIDIASYAYVDVNVAGSGGASKDILDCYTYGIMDPFIDFGDSSIKYNGDIFSTYCMISSYAFGKKYPAYINAEYVPNMISGNTSANRSTYVISYMSDEMIDRGLSYDSLPDISEWNGAGFYKGKFNFNYTEDDNRRVTRFKTKHNMSTVNQNGAYYNNEYIGDVNRIDFMFKDNLNNTYLYINAYQNGSYYYSTEPMTLGSYIIEKYNDAYGFTDKLHNSYNCIVYTDNILNDSRNAQIIDIVSWNGTAMLPQPVSNVCLKSYSDNSYTQWTDNGTAYTYSISLNQFQTMQFKAASGASYLTCQFENDAATYYFGLNNMTVPITNYGSYGYWPNADDNFRTAQWSLRNEIPATVNYTLLIDKESGQMTVTAEKPKNGWYVSFDDEYGNNEEYPMIPDGESGGYEYTFNELPISGEFVIYHYIDDVPTEYGPEISGDASEFTLDENHVGITTVLSVNWMFAEGYNTIHINENDNEAWASIV